MITPRSPFSAGAFFAITAAARRITLNVPIRLISMTRLKSSSWAGPDRPKVFAAVATPAQFTSALDHAESARRRP